MERIKDGYLETLKKVISLSGKKVLEVGCGNGARTIQIAEVCLEVSAIDPNISALNQAKIDHLRPNIHYALGEADALNFADASFDLVFFTLSLHHVPVAKMDQAIQEAVRVCKKDGHIAFLEPAFEGSFFEAEIRFDACDGDERKEKAFAYAAMLSHPHLREVAELPDETVFRFDSVDDFVTSMHPKNEDRAALTSFLQERNFILQAQRRLNIFQPQK